MKISLSALEDVQYPFVQLLELPNIDSATFSSDHFQYWKQQAVIDLGAPVEIGYLRITNREMILTQMERHEKTPEILIPLTGELIVAVAPKTGTIPQASDIKVFSVKQGQAILISMNCWHGLPFSIANELSVLVVFGNNTSLNDTIIENLSEECFVEILSD